MVDAGVISQDIVGRGLEAQVARDEVARQDEIAGLQETLAWARRVRADAGQTTICLLLADALIEQTQQLLAIAQEQLDRCSAW